MARPNRITEQERKEFHDLLDMALNKLETDKNYNKRHWSKMFVTELCSLMEVEQKELNHAVSFGSLADVLKECDDIINYAMFIKHNIEKGRK